MLLQQLIVLIIASTLALAELPPPLTMDTFDDTIKQDLHFVEFFSPYCSHCKHLAPVWEKTYERHSKLSDSLKVYMHQVNCVESGDLCDRENIRYYPLLRLYSGDGETGSLKMSYPKKWKRVEDQFIKFMREQSQVKDRKDLPNMSRHLKEQDLISVMAGSETALQRPLLVSFWPTSDEQLHQDNFDTLLQEKSFKDALFDECPDCFDLKQFWGTLSTDLHNASMDSGFVNCKSSASLCKELQMEYLTLGSSLTKSPKLVLFVPVKGQKLPQKVLYNFDVTEQKAISSWCDKLLENYRVETDVVYSDITKKMDLSMTLRRSLSLDLYVDSHVSFIYYFDDKTSVPEDFDVLPHLLQHIMDIPFNGIALYRSSDPKFDELPMRQEKSILNYIHYDELKPLAELDEEMYYYNTISSLPTLYCFKDDSLIYDKLTNFGPREIRDLSVLKSFISKNSIPFLQELNVDTFRSFFPFKFDLDVHTKQDIVVVTILDSKKQLDHFLETRLAMSVLNHEFHQLQKTKNFEFVRQQRLEKLQMVNELRLSDSKTPEEIVDALRGKIDHNENKFNVIFTYLDLSNEQTLNIIQYQGWAIDGRTYQTGDSLVVSRFGNVYWDQDVQGEPLKMTPPVITAALDDICYSKTKIRLKLINSPYGESLRFMDHIHRYGFKGYLVLFVVVVGLYPVVRRLNRRRLLRKQYDLRSKSLGILGVPKKD